jgi:hypothetical protein
MAPDLRDQVHADLRGRLVYKKEKRSLIMRNCLSGRLAIALLIGCFALSATARTQDTESDDYSSPLPESQSTTQEQDQADTAEFYDEADEQLPPEPVVVEEFPDEGLADPNVQSDDDADDRPEREFPADTDATQTQRQQEPRQMRERRPQRQPRQFDERDRGLVGPRDRRNQRLGGGRFRPRAEIRSADDLGVQFAERDDGLTIMGIEGNSLLLESGLRQGDTIVSLRNRPLRSSAEFVRWYRTLDRGARVPVQVFRDGRREIIYITAIDVDPAGVRGDAWFEPADQGGGAYLGVVFDDRFPSRAIVEIVRRNTAADRAGLRPGDVIRRINGQDVRGLRHASQLISQMRPGDDVELDFSRRTTGQAVATLGSRPDARQATYYEDYDSSGYDDEAYFDNRTTVGSTEVRTYDEQNGARTIREEERPRERVLEGDRGPVRRALTRPFRTP